MRRHGPVPGSWAERPAEPGRGALGCKREPGVLPAQPARTVAAYIGAGSGVTIQGRSGARVTETKEAGGWPPKTRGAAPSPD